MTMLSDTEDPQAKKKELGLKVRATILGTTFIIACCIGFVLSQLLYICAQQRRLGQAAVARASSVFSNDQAWAWSVIASAYEEQKLADLDALPPWHGPARNPLEKTLQNVAPVIDGRPQEILVAICTYNLLEKGLFGMFMDTVHQSNIKNYVIISLDTQLRDYLTTRGVNVYYHKVEGVEQMIGNGRAVSAQKFRILQTILELGWNVFLTDVDSLFLKNPFDHLYRDHDIEIMSDGFDEGSAYGEEMDYDDPSMGWSRHTKGMKHLNLNSGTFYVRTNKRTVQLMSRVAAVLEKWPKVWDQMELNRQLFTMSHGDYLNPGCSVRVMEIEQFMNSKVLFKTFRHKPLSEITGDKRPVLVHINYHPEKLPRMKAAFQFFLQGDTDALQRFPGGSIPGT